MTSKKFREKMVELIERSGDFTTDVIPMKDIGKLADEVIYVAGEDDKTVFLLHIQKI